MSNPITCYIHEDTLRRAESVVSTRRFRTVSDMMDFSIGLYYDHIMRDGVRTIPKLPHGQRVKKTLRVNEFIINGLVGTGFFNRGEIAEYSLRYYLEWARVAEQARRMREKIRMNASRGRSVRFSH